MVENRKEHRCTYSATLSSVRLFARTAHLFAYSGLLASLAPPAALTCLLARSLTPELMRKRLLAMKWTHRFRTVSTHSIDVKGLVNALSGKPKSMLFLCCRWCYHRIFLLLSWLRLFLSLEFDKLPTGALIDSQFESSNQFFTVLRIQHLWYLKWRHCTYLIVRKAWQMETYSLSYETCTRGTRLFYFISLQMSQGNTDWVEG